MVDTLEKIQEKAIEAGYTPQNKWNQNQNQRKKKVDLFCRDG